MSNIRLGGALAALTLAIAAAALPAWADYEVMSSTAPGYKAGQKLGDDAKMSVPEGKSVKLLDASGGTHEIAGPYEGAVADYKSPSGCPWWKRALGACPEDAGGVAGEPAATRGLR